MACHASANLEVAIPGYVAPVEDREADNAANRGTHRHEMLDPIMRLGRADVEGFAKILRYVADLRKTRVFKVLVEEKVKATWLTTEPETTLDLCLYTQDEIHVIDYKWGRIPVYAQGNEQCMYYGVSVSHLAPRAKGVYLHILQPAIDNFDMHFADTVELKQFMVDAQAAEAQIQAGDVTFGPSDHCKFCPANPHSRASAKSDAKCPTMMRLLYPPVVDEAEILGL